MTIVILLCRWVGTYRRFDTSQYLHLQVKGFLLLSERRNMGHYRIPVGARFSAPVQTGSGVHPASYTVGTGVKRPGRDVDHPHTSSAEVKERVELHPTPRLGLRGLL